VGFRFCGRSVYAVIDRPSRSPLSPQGARRVPTVLPDAVFKAYDIRGKVPDQLNPDFSRRLGLALAGRAGLARSTLAWCSRRWYILARRRRNR